MTTSHRNALVLSAAGMACLLTGCAVSRAKQYATFANAFLPSTPESPNVPAPPPLPAAPLSKLYSQKAANLLRPLAQVTASEAYVKKADEHFTAGKRFYEEGDSIAAREEFDQAIDALLSAPADLPDRQRVERKIEQMADTIFRYDVEGLGAGKTSDDEIVYDTPPLDGILKMTFPVDPNLKPKVTEELSLTSSQLPLELSDPVLGFIHYFSSDHGHKILAAGLRRAGRYRPMVERILAEERVPKELIYLAQEESGFLPRAKSPKACVGMWQFAQFRGREYGLNQSANTDDRLDPEKATRAAARHLHDLFDHFGDWYLAMAAYDCGPGCVDRAIERTGYADFWDLHRLNVLPQETKNYVPLILAITIMAKNPKDYGLDERDAESPVDADKVTLHAATSLVLVADAVGATVPELEDLNPSVLHSLAPDGFELRVPKGTANALAAGLSQVPLDHRATWRLHRVESGETLADIARRYGSAPKLIAAANSVAVEEGATGQLLVVPVSPAAITQAASRKKKSRAAVSPVYARKSGRLTQSRTDAPSHKVAQGAYAAASLHTPTAHRAAVNR